MQALAQSAFQVDWVNDGRLVASSLKASRYDALVLDLGLPGRDGHDVLDDLRDAGHQLPVLILTARDALIERVHTPRAGADDFLAKPFELAELEVRLLALIRRSRGGEHARFACGPLAYAPVTQQLLLRHQPLKLTPREHPMLCALVQHSGEPMSKRDLLERVFADEADLHPEVVEVVVHRLRQRLEGSGVRIVTSRHVTLRHVTSRHVALRCVAWCGVGYVLEPDDTALVPAPLAAQLPAALPARPPS